MKITLEASIGTDISGCPDAVCISGRVTGDRGLGWKVALSWLKINATGGNLAHTGTIFWGPDDDGYTPINLLLAEAALCRHLYSVAQDLLSRPRPLDLEAIRCEFDGLEIECDEAEGGGR